MSAMRSMPADAAMLSLQQEALQRVRQMQQRTRAAVEGAIPSPDFAPPPSAAPFRRPGGQQPGGQQPGGQQPGGQQPGGQQPGGQQPNGQQPNGQQPGGQQPGGQQPNGQQPSGQPPNGQQQRPPFAQQRPSGPENLLSQFFGGARSQGAKAGTGSPPAPRGGAAGSGAQRQPGPGGLLDLIRGSFSSGESAGLGDSLRKSISTASKPLSDLLDAFSIDGEKLLILLVMWVIFNERSDNKTLLLALGYLLL